MRGDIHAVGLPDASVDRVHTDRVLQHVADPAGVLAEVARVLRPGGLFGLVENVSPDPSIMTDDAAALAAAADEYNAFEKHRDPSHVRCLTLAEWRGLVADAGLKERHVELLDKPMVLGPWADQQNVGAEIKHDLRTMLLDGSPAFRAFARPQENKGDVDFVLTEAVIIAQK